VFDAIPSAPAERLARIIELLCRAIAARGGLGRVAAPLVVLIWARLRRLVGRILRLAARIEAGTPPRPRRRAARPRLPRPTRRPPPTCRLPRGRAWLLRLVPGEGACAASQLRHLLTEPDMLALAAADPRMGRLLRPLCHMLGVAPPPVLAPAQVRSPPAAPAAPAADAPAAPRLPKAAAPWPAAPVAPAPPRQPPAAPPRRRPAICGPPLPA
jgi:hypothetical protein